MVSYTELSYSDNTFGN